MLRYQKTLKEPARKLRGTQTEAEQCLWQKIRRKQLANVQFYRQKPIGSYIVDFYAPAVKLVIEVDGEYHREEGQTGQDAARDLYLNQLGLTVLRFENCQVLQAPDDVVEVIHQRIIEYLNLP